MPDDPFMNMPDFDPIAGWAGSTLRHGRKRPAIDPQRAFERLIEGQQLLYRAMTALQDEVAATLKVMNGRVDVEMATMEHGLDRLVPSRREESAAPEARTEPGRADPLDADQPRWTIDRKRLSPERLSDLERNRRLMVIRREELLASNALLRAARDTRLALGSCRWVLFGLSEVPPVEGTDAPAASPSLPHLENVMALDWSQCPAVHRAPHDDNGPWVLWGTDVPAATIFEALEKGASLDDLLGRHKGLDREQVQGVIRFAARSLKPDSVP